MGLVRVYSNGFSENFFAKIEKRVDAMVREYNGQIYLITVRFSEIEDTANAANIESKITPDGAKLIYDPSYSLKATVNSSI